MPNRSPRNITVAGFLLLSFTLKAPGQVPADLEATVQITGVATPNIEASLSATAPTSGGGGRGASRDSALVPAASVALQATFASSGFSKRATSPRISSTYIWAGSSFGSNSSGRPAMQPLKPSVVRHLRVGRGLSTGLTHGFAAGDVSTPSESSVASPESRGTRSLVPSSKYLQRKPEGVGKRRGEGTTPSDVEPRFAKPDPD